jgi:Asp-tRNA(Asn)/Glu-tRNA(Gln) amidotransferase A subunit family amidase
MTPEWIDMAAARGAIAAGRDRSSALYERAQHAADGDAMRHAFIRRFDGAAGVAAFVDAQRQVGAPLPPLAGLAVSVKDLFDVAGQVATAGSVVLADRPPASADAPAVARLRAAGAALVGHTNMTEFAFSGVGINPHHGTPLNPATARLDATPRIPGGSTSGGAVSVAAGAAWAALGSDTGGSIRIPAALQGLVGFKSTARRVPTDGCVPLSTTLDTACAITRSVRDAVLVDGILAARTATLAARPLRALRLALPTTTMLDALDAGVARAFDRAIDTLRGAGATIEEVALPELDRLSRLQVAGGFAAAESWAWHRRLLAAHEADYDPRVAQRIRRGAAIGTADYIDLIEARRAWIAALEPRLRGFDALLSPTVAIVAPAIAPLVESDAAFHAANALLLRNTSVVNMLDGCALSMPCHAAGELPVGLMVWSAAMQDETVLDASLAIEVALAAAPSAPPRG